MSETRIPIVRVDADGTITDGTAMLVETGDAFGVGDFRDLDGEPLILPPGSHFDITWEAHLPPGVDPADFELVARGAADHQLRALLDPDSPHWPWRHASRRQRRFQEEFSRYQLALVDSGVDPTTDVRYNEMMAESWRRSTRFWRQARWWAAGVAVLQVATLVMQVAIGSPLWLIGVTAGVFLTTGGLQFRRRRSRRAWLTRSRQLAASFEENVRILKADAR